jgi:integrase
VIPAKQAKAMSRDELAEMLALVPDQWRLFFWFLAATGVRISEAVALQWRHLDLDAPVPHVRVRRALVKGRMGPPKSRYGRREFPRSAARHSAPRAPRGYRVAGWRGPRIPGVQRIAAHAKQRLPASALTRSGGRRPSWVGFHAFRHTCASILFAEDRNAVQVQRWLGHHSAAFTLATHVHLLDGALGEPLAILQKGGRGIEAFDAVLNDERLPEKFRNVRLRQMQDRILALRERHSS